MLNRRHFLLSGTSTLAAMAAVPNAIAGPVNSILDLPKSQAKQSVKQGFEQKIGDRFLLRNENGFTQVKLKEIEHGPQADGLEQFTLVFTSSESVQSDLYKATHLKSLSSSLVRIEPSYERKQHYLATFSLLT